MYTDDAALFLAPVKKEVAALAELLTLFREATGLRMNFQNLIVVPICCSGIDINDIMANLPAKRAHFSIKYLGLPLTTVRLRRIYFQQLVDKVVAKLNVWNGQNVNHTGRLTLVKSVLTSQAVYFLTAFKAPRTTLKDIDAKRKQFLWAGTERITGAKCKVNWTRVARSKKNGGLGIQHLGKFARALHLRWLWQQWCPEDKPWIGAEIPCNNTDRLLFAPGTTITVGDGNRVSFKNSSWMQGQRPKDVAP